MVALGSRPRMNAGSRRETSSFLPLRAARRSSAVGRARSEVVKVLTQQAMVPVHFIAWIGVRREVEQVIAGAAPIPQLLRRLY